MKELKGLESSLGGIFKNAPKMPENAKKSLVNWMPWIAIISAVIYAWGTWGFYRLFQLAEGFGRFANEFSRAVGGGDVYDGSIGVFGWLWIIVSVIQVVLMVAAVPGLMNRTRSGWQMMFLAEVVLVVATVVSLFRGVNTGSGFISGLLGAVIGFYLLFQIKDHYKGTA